MIVSFAQAIGDTVIALLVMYSIGVTWLLVRRERQKPPRALDLTDQLAEELLWWQEHTSRWNCDAQTLGRHTLVTSDLLYEARNTSAATGAADESG